MAEEVTAVTEEYLEGIYRLQERGGVARTGEIVKLLKVAPGTVTNTVERLEREGLVTHKSYRGVRLTEKGRRMALRVVRRHRLSERLLTDLLRVEWSRAHQAACGLEHGIADDIAKSLEEALGHPKTCPHGNPIPTERGGVLEEKSEPLTDLGLHKEGTIVKITEEETDLLQYLAGLGLMPGTTVKMLEKAPFEGPVTLKVGDSSHALSRRVASVIMVGRAR